MKSALLCVFFALIIHKEGSLAADDDFRPTPIPLNDWNGSSRESVEHAKKEGANAGTLQEMVASDASPPTAAVPAHYWEDALRHSVYLTLVRDKIDQLIAKGSLISPDNKPDQHAPKDFDDHDLWEKIKTAPFDRLTTEEPGYLGDIAIIAKGRLLEQKSGLRFTEDEMSKEKCTQNCMEDVKAYWSIKRVRQRDAETVPGKYHYELTFLVSSQTPKKQNKPYENPVRTFTVREGVPSETPQYRTHEPPVPPHRPQRAVWIHKNIVPTAPHQHRNEDLDLDLDRLFSSWFSLDEEEPATKRYKQAPYVPQMHAQRSKVGYVGAPTGHHNQKQILPYPHKSKSQTTYKYSRPPLGQPPVSQTHSQHHYPDMESIRYQNQYIPSQSEFKYFSTNNVKTTKPAVLPTPPISYAPLNTTMEMAHNFNATESTPKDPEIITGFTMYSKPRPSPTKVSYFPEHVRPPVFNAPPGVFVTMDKKPFKPMPPLKYLHSQKGTKHKPIDFRPSPQVLDAQFSDPLSVPSTDAFRPITIGYGVNNTDSSESADDDIRAKPHRKSKPPKKHDNVKSHRTTTSAPEIITAHNEVLEEMHWANILGAFAKTTPMIYQTMNISETTTPTISSTTVTSTTTASTTDNTEREKITTTIEPAKPRRTRPPPKFAKPMKAKKHKRITSTTTPSTTTTEKQHHRRPTQDLTPQASSAATGISKSTWQPSSKIYNATLSTTPISANETKVIVTSTTTEPSTTTAKVVLTTYSTSTTTRQKANTTEAPNTTTDITSTVSTSQSKNKNRFRQSTLMNKGTSVNHDKWSSPHLIENKTTVDRARLAQKLSGKFPRRKGSNFQGYMGSTRKIVDAERDREDHRDYVSKPNLNVISLSSTTAATTKTVPMTTPKPTQVTNDNIATSQQNESELDDAVGTEDPDDNDEDLEEEDDSEPTEEQETKDQTEYIFDTSTTSTTEYSGVSDHFNEVDPETESATEETVVTSQQPVVRNKPKCKKKKDQNQETNPIAKSTSELETEVSVAPLEITTEKLSTADFFNEIFGLTMDQKEGNSNQSESKYVDNDEDLEEFLDSINGNKDGKDGKEDEYESEDTDNNDENSPYNNDEDNRYPRNADASYEDYQDSFLGLMAME